MDRAVIGGLVALGGLVWGMQPAAADVPLSSLASWEGNMDYFVTGAPLAIDGPDADTTQVDTLDQPASVVVTTTDIPATATVVTAYLYWAGTIGDQTDCADTSNTDDTVTLTVPGPASAPVTADICYCAEGAGSYDIQACRADITTVVAGSGMFGTFTVDGFAAKATNGATDNASFAIMLVYEELDLLAPRRIGLFDGVEQLYQGTRLITLDMLDVDNPAVGDLAWYALDGDVGGGGTESVTVAGVPGGGSAVLFDAVNPSTNPMNRTINTTTPAQTGVIGTDIDRLDLSAGLTPGDTAVNMTYEAGNDKYWVVFNMVAINIFIPIVSNKSTKTWALAVDADSSGDPTPGDTIRYTISLENVGTAPANIDVTDLIPSAAESWVLISTGGGIDASNATTLMVQNVVVAPDAIVDVVFDMVLSPASAGTVVTNVAGFDATPEGNLGSVSAPPLPVDFGPVDAGVPDAAIPDGGPVDAAVPDAAVPDAAVPDASLPIDAMPPVDGVLIDPDAAASVDASTGAGSATGCYCRGAGGGVPPVGSLIVMAFVLLGLRAPRLRHRCRESRGNRNVIRGNVR